MTVEVELLKTGTKPHRTVRLRQKHVPRSVLIVVTVTFALLGLLFVCLCIWFLVGTVEAPNALASSNPTTSTAKPPITTTKSSLLPTAVCQMPNDLGSGSRSVIRWWFDWSYKACKRFGYRGSGGNKNNFLSESDCEKMCGAFKP
ncbi:hypothetical protein AAHC03_01441 [Spirometra sp. Aus1]